MKFLQLALLLALLALLAACQTSSPTPVATQYPLPPTEAPQPVLESYPVPRPAYLPELPYPEPGQNFANIDWTLAEQVLLSGQVSQVVQTHALEVTLTLQDGRVFKATEPAIDDVIKVIERCGDPCSSIAVATE